MAKYNRTVDPRVADDPHSAAIAKYNLAAGAEKNLSVGPVLLPIQAGATFTCNATTAKGLPAIGKNIAVYNNAGAVGSITLGTDGTVTSLAPGVTNAAGQAGIACPPNAWTYISMGNQQFLIASAATLLCYVVDDGTYLTLERN